jgi:hypothetical protein
MVSITQDSETALEAILEFNPSPEFFDSVPDETIRELALLWVAPSDKPTSERISDFRSGVGTALLMSTGELSPELVLIADIVAGLAAAGSLRTFTEAQRKLAEIHIRLQATYESLKAMHHTYHALETLKEQEDQDE